MRTRTRVSTSPADPKLARDAPGGSGVLEFGGGVGVTGTRSSGDLRGRTTTPEIPDTRIARVLLKGKLWVVRAHCVCGVLVSHRVFGESSLLGMNYSFCELEMLVLTTVMTTN